MSLVVKLERQSFVALRGRKVISTLGSWWANHDRPLLRIAVSLMLVAAIVWLGYEFWRLLWQQGRWGAIDLRIFHRWSQQLVRRSAGKECTVPASNLRNSVAATRLACVCASQMVLGSNHSGRARMVSLFGSPGEPRRYAFRACLRCIDASFDVRHGRDHRQWTAYCPYSAPTGGRSCPPGSATTGVAP